MAESRLQELLQRPSTYSSNQGAEMVSATSLVF
jgi:hypothetical protein